MKQIDEPVDVYLNRVLSSLEGIPIARGNSKTFVRWFIILNGIYKRTDTDLSFDDWCNDLFKQFIDSQKKQGLL